MKDAIEIKKQKISLKEKLKKLKKDKKESYKRIKNLIKYYKYNSIEELENNSIDKIFVVDNEYNITTQSVAFKGYGFLPPEVDGVKIFDTSDKKDHLMIKIARIFMNIFPFFVFKKSMKIPIIIKGEWTGPVADELGKYYYADIIGKWYKDKKIFIIFVNDTSEIQIVRKKIKELKSTNNE